MTRLRRMKLGTEEKSRFFVSGEIKNGGRAFFSEEILMIYESNYHSFSLRFRVDFLSGADCGYFPIPTLREFTGNFLLA